MILLKRIFDMKEKLGRTVRSPWFPLILLWCGIGVAHLFFPTNTADDAWFAQVLEGDRANIDNWLAFLRLRYGNWSSRIAIEGPLIFFARFPWVWRVANAAVFIGATARFASLFNPRRQVGANWVFLTVFLLFPLGILFEVGSIATTLNYLWPFAAALVAVTPCVKRYLGQEIRRWEWILAFPALLFACFAELLCATLVLFFFGSGAWRFFAKKEIPIFDLACVAVCGGMLIFALTCPGNEIRTAQEIQTWFPTYGELGLLERIELGFSSMMKSLFLRSNVFCTAFCIVIAWSLGKRCRSVWRRVLAWIPAAFSLIFGAAGVWLSKVIPPVAMVIGWVGDTGTGLRLTQPLTWIPDLIFVGILVCLLISLHGALDDQRLFWLFFFLLAVGAASRIAMGLSPTVWASGERTCFYLYICMATVLGNLVRSLFEIKEFVS